MWNEYWEMKVEKWRKGWPHGMRDVLWRLHACQDSIGKKVFGQREKERTLCRIWPIFVCSKENNVDANTKPQSPFLFFKCHVTRMQCYATKSHHSPHIWISPNPMFLFSFTVKNVIQKLHLLELVNQLFLH